MQQKNTITMVDKRPMGVIAGKSDYLEKKIPKNPKYSSVNPTVNTGYHANHIEVVSDQKIAKRKGELFRRIKPSTLMNLLKVDTNAESIYNLVDTDKENIRGYDDFGDDQSVYSAYTAKTGYSEVSKLSSVTSATEQLVLGDSSEFLLLDLREPEEFELFHIKESLSYPAPNLGRDKVIPELFKFKNKEGKLIIVYHLDERNGIPHANLMAQKGYENIYLLSGGIEAFLEEYPQFVEGKKIPVLPKQNKKQKIVYKRSQHVGNPGEGDVNIASKHIQDNKSTISNLTKTSGITNSSKINQKTTTLPKTNKTSTLSSSISKIKK